MNDKDVDNLHKAYRDALSEYTGAREEVEALGKALTEIGGMLSAPGRRTRIWNMFCAGEGNDLTPDDRSLKERADFSNALDLQRLSTALGTWKSAKATLMASHAGLQDVGEEGNAAMLPSDIRNTR